MRNFKIKKVQDVYNDWLKVILNDDKEKNNNFAENINQNSKKTSKHESVV